MTRVLELIDVWFDSGSMPYAQWHYPFENREEFKNQFPADFICEAVDQTRGWFYSMHAISTLLYDQICFKNCLVLGLILDAEGQKMSKSRGNVADPWEVLNTHGADAMRWYLYTASPSGQERRYSADLVSEVVRNFTLTLWNTYSFFVTYANLDQWKPDPEAKYEPSELDRWLRSTLHTLVRDVTVALETYDVIGATRPIETFVDQLSNWYLRRSRRRFWKSESDADKYAAYATLYEVLVTISKLLAPTMPFLAEEIYQNLARSGGHDTAESVHLVEWPLFDSGVINEKLNRDMALVMKLASVGHAARNKANRKVRQPLAAAAFSVGNAEEMKVVSEYADLLADELNVKEVRVLSSAGEAVTYSLNPLPKQLGQKYGSKFPAIRKALLELDAESPALTLLSGEKIEVPLEDGTYDIQPEDVEVRVLAREGFAVAAEGATVAALVTDLTPELVDEGLAREFIRRVQDLRKQVGLDIADRIYVYYEATPGLLVAVKNNSTLIKAEILALEMFDSLPGDLDETSASNFDGQTLKVGLKKS
jgi:isoleucyl-tRNA synthetase